MTRPVLELRRGGRARKGAHASIKTCAAVTDPRVMLMTEHIAEQLIVLIEEGEAVIELTFPDPAAVERFKRRVALLPVHLITGAQPHD